MCVVKVLISASLILLFPSILGVWRQNKVVNWDSHFGCLPYLEVTILILDYYSDHHGGRLIIRESRWEAVTVFVFPQRTQISAGKIMLRYQNFVTQREITARHSMLRSSCTILKRSISSKSPTPNSEIPHCRYAFYLIFTITMQSAAVSFWLQKPLVLDKHLSLRTFLVCISMILL